MYDNLNLIYKEMLTIPDFSLWAEATFNTICFFAVSIWFISNVLTSLMARRSTRTILKSSITHICCKHIKEIVFKTYHILHGLLTYLIHDAVRGRYCTIRYSWNIMPVWNYFLFLEDLPCKNVTMQLLCARPLLDIYIYIYIYIWCHNTSDNTLWCHIMFHIIYEWMVQWYAHSKLTSACFCYFVIN